MPSKNAIQHNFAAMSATIEGRKRLKALGKKPMPMKVAKEFLAADRGKSFKKSRRKT